MTLAMRKPTGKPSWPILLLAGAEKTGKSYGAALAAGSDLIGRTYWVTVGEDQPDEYGLLADFDIVEHDGTYRGLRDVLAEVAAQPKPEKGPPLLVVDSMTRLWDLITDQAQSTANARAEAKARKYNRQAPSGDSPISMDLWNLAKSQWGHVMDQIRAFPGPVIVTARLEWVSVMGPDGQPANPPQKQLKVKAEKSLPFDVGAVVEMPFRGESWLTGVRSVRLKLAERTLIPDFTVDEFWRRLGLHELETSQREHVAPQPVADPVVEDGGWLDRDWVAEAEAAPTSRESSALGAAAKAAGAPAEVLEQIRAVVAEKRAAGNQPQLQAVEERSA